MGWIAVAFLVTQAACQHLGSMERPVTIELTVPDPAWKVTIERVYQADERLLAVARVERDPEVMAAQVISKASDTVRVRAPDLPVEHYVIGKTWNWAEEDYHFVTEAEVDKATKGARLIWRNGG